MQATAHERLAAARAAVDQVCQLLLAPTPERMDRCIHLLEAAVGEITACSQPQDPAGGMADLPNEIGEHGRRLMTSIGRARGLLESANSFYANWIRCFSAICGGYTGQGQPAAIDRGVHLLARG